MSKLGIKGSIPVHKGRVELKLSLLKFKEDDIVFIYSPALDLTGYGKDGRSAKRSFEITVEEFVNYTSNKGTLDKELKRLGWRMSGSKRAPKFKQPYLDELFQARPYLGDIIRNKEFERYEEQVLFPAA
ncbi:MAG TPA: hypothetical protein PK760_04100 [Flavobacteriales bacterium]|nr:hypothetical protein [Flavobacteriales bacterium]